MGGSIDLIILGLSLRSPSLLPGDSLIVSKDDNKNLRILSSSPDVRHRFLPLVQLFSYVLLDLQCGETVF